MKKIINWIKLQLTISIIKSFPDKIYVLNSNDRLVKQYNLGGYWVNYGEWHHIQKTSDGLGNEFMYVNGEQINRN